MKKVIKIVTVLVFTVILINNNILISDSSELKNKEIMIYKVNKSNLNIKKSPSIFSKKLGEIGKGDIVYILNKNENWGEINYYGEKAYINTKRLKPLTDNEEIQKTHIDLDEHLYISTVYTNPDFDIKEDIILKYYATDYNHTAYMEDDYSEVFKIILKLNGETIEFKRSIGENTLNLGKKREGQYQYTIQAIDRYGRKSPELYGEFRVENKKKKYKEIDQNTYYVTERDLLQYGISKLNDKSKSNQTKIGLQNLINDLSSKGVRKCILPKGIYRIDSEYEEIGDVQKVKNVINIPSNFILDLNGSTLKQERTLHKQSKGYMISIDNSYDAHVINGIIEGDYGERDISNLENGNPSGEQIGCGIISGDSKYSSFENLTVRNFSGYAISVGLSINGEHALSSCEPLTNWHKVEIDEEGQEIESIDKYTSDYHDLSKYSEVDTLRTGKYLGYQFSLDGDEWTVNYSFYDKDKKYIKTIIGHQYRSFVKPKNAIYMRATYTSDNIEKLKDIQVYHMYTPINSVIRNIDFENTRTCALNPNQGNNILIENCTFTRCGTNITPAAIDFEDGWNLMQDYCVRRNEVIDPVGTADIIVVGGMNLQFENNKNFRFSNRGCTPGTVIRNNQDLYGGLYITNRLNSGYYRYYNNQNVKGIGDIDSDDLKYKIYDCTFFEIPAGSKNMLIEFIRCSFDWNYKTLPFNTGGIICGNFKDSIIKNYIDSENNFIHLNDAYFNNCKLENIKANINGDFYVKNSNVKNLIVSNYMSDININIEDSQIYNFEFDFTEWAKCSYNINLKNSVFKNENRDNIFSNNFANYNHNNKFIIIIDNNKFLNTTKIANNVVINNKNITFLNNK